MTPTGASEIDSIVRAHFDALAEDYDVKCRARERYLSAIDRLVLAELSRYDRIRLLDAGCGNGRRASRFSSRLNLADLQACDASAAMVELARRRGLHQTVQADIRSLPYPDRSFDAVICLFNVLGYMPSRRHVLRALQEFHRVLDEGGLLLTDVMNAWHLGESISFRLSPLEVVARMARGLADGDIYRIRFSLEVGGRSIPGCMRGFTRRGFSSLLRAAGFDIRVHHIVGYDSGELHRSQRKGQHLFIAVKAVRRHANG